MGVAYWKMVGESIAKGLGEKTIRRLSTGGKFLGRTGAVVGIGFLAYELFKNYKENIENEPAYKEMIILQAEMEMWTSAISCIGRQPLEEKRYGSFDEGGAINALYEKKLFGGQAVKAPDPKEACTLIERSIEYILLAENLLEDDKFEERRKALADWRNSYMRSMIIGRFKMNSPELSMRSDQSNMATLHASMIAARRFKRHWGQMLHGLQYRWPR
jgi:hypothetical protein